MCYAGLVGAAIFGMLVTAAAGSVVAQAPAEYGPIFVFNCCALATASLRGAGTQGLFSGDAESESIAHNMEGEEGDGGKCMTELGVVEFCVSDASSNEAGGAHERGEDEKDGDEMSVEDEVFLAKWADKVCMRAHDARALQILCLSVCLSVSLCLSLSVPVSLLPSH